MRNERSFRDREHVDVKRVAVDAILSALRLHTNPAFQEGIRAIVNELLFINITCTQDKLVPEALSEGTVDAICCIFGRSRGFPCFIENLVKSDPTTYHDNWIWSLIRRPKNEVSPFSIRLFALVYSILQPPAERLDISRVLQDIRSIIEKARSDQSMRAGLMRTIGEFGFTIGTRIATVVDETNFWKGVPQNLFNDSDAGTYARIGISRPLDSMRDTYRLWIEQALREKRPLVLDGLSKWIPMYGMDYSGIIVWPLRSALFKHESVQLVVATLAQLPWDKRSFDLTLLSQVGQLLSSDDYSVRKKAATFLISSQDDYPQISVMLAGYVSLESVNKLRLMVIPRIRVNSEVVALCLQSLLMEASLVSESVLELLCPSPYWKSHVPKFVSEIVRQINKARTSNILMMVHSLGLVITKHPEVVHAFAGQLLRDFLDSERLRKNPYDAVCLRLVRDLLVHSPPDVNVAQLTAVIIECLKDYGKGDRQLEALNLFSTAVVHIRFEKEFLLPLLFAVIELSGLVAGDESEIARMTFRVLGKIGRSPLRVFVRPQIGRGPNWCHFDEHHSCRISSSQS
jgi:hypothetical protein